MKKIILTSLTIAILIGAALAQDKHVNAQSYEYGMIKWDGPDKIQIITPEKTEYIRVFKTGVKLPENIHDEEFCDVWAMNRVAKDGWEAVMVHATRILIRRPLTTY
jgi:hypothetical protein